MLPANLSEPTGCIYLITNLINGKYYVGQTTRSARIRFNGHFSEAKRRKVTVIGNALRKYGKDNFALDVLVECPIDQLDDYERLWIAVLRSTDKKNGYNIYEGGWGARLTEETKAKISAARKGKKLSDADRRAISESNTRPFLGKKHDDATKQLMSFLKKGKPLLPSHAGKIVEAIKLRWKDDEFRKKMSIAHTGERNHMFGVPSSAQRDPATGRFIPRNRPPKPFVPTPHPRGAESPIFGRKQSPEHLAKRVAWMRSPEGHAFYSENAKKRARDRKTRNHIESTLTPLLPFR